MLKELIKFPILKRIIPSILIRILKITNKNRGYFKIKDIDMYLDFLDPIDREIILNKNYETDEFNFTDSLFEKHAIDAFVDIGANCGYYLFALSKNQTHLIGFEPNKEAFQKMVKTLEKNDILKRKIDIYNLEDIYKNDYNKVKFIYCLSQDIINTIPFITKNLVLKVGDRNYTLNEKNKNRLNEELDWLKYIR